MRAVVLVGGEGTRLRPLTYGTPKPLLPIAGVTIIERVLAHLASAGVDHAILSMGYRPDAFLDAFPDGHAGGVALTYAVEPERMDTAGAIRFAALAAGVDDRFVVVNGDILTDLSVAELVSFHEERGAEATIALTPVEDPSAFGVVPTDEEGRVTAFIEKPAKGEAPTNLINAGIYVLEPSVIDRIPDGRPVNVEREVFPAIAAEGRLYAMPFPDAYWTDTGTPQLFLDATLDLVSGARGCEPAPGAQERDGIWLVGSPVLDGEVRSPALIGDAAFVAKGAVVERSAIGTGARVGAGAVVRNSVLLPGAVVEDDAIIDGSIVGEGALVKPGAHVTGLSVVQGGASVEEGARLHEARVVLA